MSQESEKKQSKWPIFISLIILGTLVASYFIIPEFQQFLKQTYEILLSDDKQRISDWVSDLGWWGPISIIIIMILQMFLLIIPSPLLMVVAVLAYGPVWGALLSIIAVMCSATVGYWIGRYLGLATVQKLIGSKKEKQMEYYVERYGAWAIIITRLAPLLSNDAISLVGGILRMSYWKFLAATLAGIAPLSILIAYFGENNDRMKSGLIWTSLVSLVLFVGYIIYDRKINPVNDEEN